MISTIKQQIGANATEAKFDDPRIDSPDVKVIYPSPIDQAERQTIGKGKADTVETETTLPPLPIMQEQPVEKKEEHVCKVDIQEAVKQNLLGFIVLVVLSLGIGYLIGKK